MSSFVPKWQHRGCGKKQLLAALAAALSLAATPGFSDSAAGPDGVMPDGEQPKAEPEAASQDNDLSSSANDPTASLMAFQLQHYYAPNLHNGDGSRRYTQFRAAIPYQAFGYNNIARLTLPYFHDTGNGTSGFGDTTLFNLTTFDRDWGRFGLGAVALLPTGAEGVSAEKWAVGPALGFVAQTGFVAQIG